ncbi:NIPSNAP family protein [Roseomonas nepalensis]|uniref:NIPSNAP family protein n=1 Tax=Muricoccus nepalensis TaxID=1854500 RepID=A0A502GEU0_9PROT|nr:NIPSNAP family protein [Roseomonas nepalensis]TPG60251.1 NIPSNAP family protein [Roseomonas nepalensis]
MIVEERIYTLQAGQAAAYVAAYEAEGMAIQKPILGRMVGYYTTEFGPLNQVVHLWAYESLAERTERRAHLLADPAWKAYAAKVRPMVVTQENKLLTPAPFLRVTWQD